MYDKLGRKTQVDKNKLVDLKRASEYSLVSMDVPTKKKFADPEVFKVKAESREGEMERDRRERDEFSRRLLEKDKEKATSKNKPALKNTKGVTLTTEEK